MRTRAHVSRLNPLCRCHSNASLPIKHFVLLISRRMIIFVSTCSSIIREIYVPAIKEERFAHFDLFFFLALSRAAREIKSGIRTFEKPDETLIPIFLFPIFSCAQISKVHAQRKNSRRQG